MSLSSAGEIATQIRRKEVSPVEVARAHLDRIERLNPSLNAFIDYQPEAVLVQARVAEKAILRGEDLGPLHGVPLSIKSSIDVAGHRCEAGSRLRAGRVAAVDAPLVTRLRAAGAVILGVTNAPELLMAWETDNLLYGRTNNPWDLSRTAGGSSGGEAAAIAAISVSSSKRVRDSMRSACVRINAASAARTMRVTRATRTVASPSACAILRSCCDIGSD